MDYFKRLKFGVKKLGPVNKFLFWVAIIASILSLIYFFFGVCFGPTKKNQQAMLSNDQRVLKLLEEMKRIDETGYENLIKRYPLGYAIFAVDHREVIIPYNSRLEKEVVEIKWNTANISKLTEREIILQLPSFIDIHNVQSYGNYVGGERKIGRIGHGLGTHGIAQYAELLIDGPEGLIFVVGFKEVKSRTSN